MLPIFLAAALAVQPPSEVELRYAVRAKQAPMTAPDILVERWRAEAVDLRDAYKPADALILFNAAMLLYPEHLDVRIGRAKTFAALGRYDEQADEYAWVIARNPNSYEAWHEVAEGWIARRKWVEAEQCFARAAELVPAGKLRCQVLVEEALRWLSVDQADYPHQIDLARTAELPFERLTHADATLNSALVFDTDAVLYKKVDIILLRGLAQQSLGMLAQAKEAYDKVLVEHPLDITALTLRASIAVLTSDFPKAFKLLDSLEQQGRESKLIAQIRCKALIGGGEYERAATAAVKWREIDPASSDAYLYRGITLRLLDKHDEADEVTMRAAEVNGLNYAVQAWTEMWAIWVWYNRPDKAELLLTHVLSQPLCRTERAKVYAIRADLRRQLWTEEDAFLDATTAVRLVFDDPFARKKRAELAFRLRRYEIGFEDAEALTRLDPSDPVGHKLLAEARSAITMYADLAGREPDFHPVGPVMLVPFAVSVPRQMVVELHKRQFEDVRWSLQEYRP